MDRKTVLMLCITFVIVISIIMGVELEPIVRAITTLIGLGV